MRSLKSTMNCVEKDWHKRPTIPMTGFGSWSFRARRTHEGDDHEEPGMIKVWFAQDFNTTFPAALSYTSPARMDEFDAET